MRITTDKINEVFGSVENCAKIMKCSPCTIRNIASSKGRPGPLADRIREELKNSSARAFAGKSALIDSVATNILNLIKCKPLRIQEKALERVLQGVKDQINDSEMEGV